MLKRLFRQSKTETSLPLEIDDPGTLYQVTADATRCVQCGICGHNCPVGIEVREYARRGENVTDCRCINCGTCITLCPRGTLRWGPAILVRADNSLEIDPISLPDRLQLTPRDIK